MKRALFLLTLFVVLPILAMVSVYQIAISTSASDAVATEENTSSLKADRDFYMMSQTEHLAKAKQLYDEKASKEQLFQARQHLVSIPIGAPEYAEAMSLLGQIEKIVRPSESRR